MPPPAAATVGELRAAVAAAAGTATRALARRARARVAPRDAARLPLPCDRARSAAVPAPRFAGQCGHAAAAASLHRGSSSRPSTRPSRARLVLIARDGGEGPSYPLAETTDIGRTEGNIVIADDRYVSPRHARVALRGGAYYLRDLGSTNGVFVRIPFPRGTSGGAGGAEMPEPDDSEQALGDQDLFLVGQQVLRFEVVKHAEEGFGVASENGTLLFGTPAAPRYARLSQRTVEGVVRDVFHVRKAETVIGRESGDIVFTDDPFLSRRHAVVRVHGAARRRQGPRRFTLADLGSSNGTFLQVREEVRLQHGDHFRIGQQLFRFDTSTASPDAPSTTPTPAPGGSPNGRLEPRAARRDPREALRADRRRADPRAQRGQLPRRRPDAQAARPARGEPHRASIGPHGCALRRVRRHGRRRGGRDRQPARGRHPLRADGRRARRRPHPLTRDELARRLVRAIEAAGLRIFQEAKVDRTRRGMGTTVTAAALVDDHLFFAQVGDSRGYLLRQGQLVQLTRDQSLVNQLIEAGQLTEEEAETFEHNNIILQALGTADTVQVDLTYCELRAGRRRCCSAPTGCAAWSASTRSARSCASTAEPLDACKALTERANQAGGHDNITVIVAQFDGEGLLPEGVGRRAAQVPQVRAPRRAAETPSRTAG